MTKNLRLEVASKYGREIYYPKDELSQLVCDLLGQKSLTKENLRLFAKNGWQVDLETRASKSFFEEQAV
jgi:hypothetical protein